MDVFHEVQKRGSPNLPRVEENGIESDGQENKKAEIKREYTYYPFLKVCRDEGIVRHFIVPGKPQQNGVAESMN